MKTEKELVTKFIDILGKQDPTPEEKKLKALIKSALTSDNLISYINEVYRAFNGQGKVSVDTVKGVVEYFKANNEVQIRNMDISEEEKDRMVKQERDRLTEVEVWTLGALAHFGWLK